MRINTDDALTLEISVMTVFALLCFDERIAAFLDLGQLLPAATRLRGLAALARLSFWRLWLLFFFCIGLLCSCFLGLAF